MNRSYRTPKGTDLPILDLRGKEYLEVKYRLIWFREVYPDWRIESEILNHSPESTLAKAIIRDNVGNQMATAHKQEDKRGFADHLEKAETGAIGRALATLGFGTQFCADDLDEGKRIVDAPVDPKKTVEQKPAPQKPAPQKPAPQKQQTRPAVREAKVQAQATADNPGEHRIDGGSVYSGKTIKEAIQRDGLPAVQKYLQDLDKLALEIGRPLWGWAVEMKVNLERYERQMMNPKDVTTTDAPDWSDEPWPEGR